MFYSQNIYMPPKLHHQAMKIIPFQLMELPNEVKIDKYVWYHYIFQEETIMVLAIVEDYTEKKRMQKKSKTRDFHGLYIYYISKFI